MECKPLKIVTKVESILRSTPDILKGGRLEEKRGREEEWVAMCERARKRKAVREKQGKERDRVYSVYGWESV